MFAHKSIKNKDIYIVENHHHVLEPWAIYRKESTEAPILITLDHHTDCHSSFLSYCGNKYQRENQENIDKREVCMKMEVQNIDYNDVHTVKDAIEKLKHDEHIDTAIKSGIIKNAFVISYQGHSDEPMSFKEQKRIKEAFSYEAISARIKGEPYVFDYKEGYPESESGIYILAANCWIGDANVHSAPHDDTCTKPHYDQAIESIYLQDKLNTINKMKPGLVVDNKLTEEYILDIDLDYFHTLKSINPEKLDVFYDLIKKAKIITVAVEPVCVEMLKYEGEEINSSLLLSCLLAHIENALQGK